MTEQNGDRARVAYVLALAVAVVMVLLAITVLWGVVIDQGGVAADSERFFALILGAVIGVLASYVGKRVA